jgi:dTDP-glucose 4,6-dehydratase
MNQSTRVLVTGAFGFIGSYLTKMILSETDWSVIGTGRNTNQRNMQRLEGYEKHPRLTIIYKDLALDDISELFREVDFVFHTAAKTFVDHSIIAPYPFIESNIVGTYKMLEEARKSKTLKRYFQISTDEVYGAILDGAYREDSRLNPTNPYAATKAAGDMLVVSYNNTYGLDTIITRTENNYGPFQNPEKAIPTFVRKALADQPLPVYGDGKHRRMWLHVSDHCRALLHLAKHGKSGEIYHIAGEQELENLELAKTILRILSKPEDMIQLVPDYNIRPGHDRRYALNVQKLRATGWVPRFTLDTGLRDAVDWYVENKWWFQ